MRNRKAYSAANNSPYVMVSAKAVPISAKLVGTADIPDKPCVCDCPCDAILEELGKLKQTIGGILEKLKYIEGYLYPSDVDEIWSGTKELMGLGVAVIRIGYMFNFWGIGKLESDQTIIKGQTYYLIRRDEFPYLDYYYGTATIGAMWIETPEGVLDSMPVRFDKMGIYFTPGSQFPKLPAGTRFKFTYALILVPLEEEIPGRSKRPRGIADTGGSPISPPENPRPAQDDE